MGGEINVLAPSEELEGDEDGEMLDLGNVVTRGDTGGDEEVAFAFSFALLLLLFVFLG